MKEEILKCAICEKILSIGMIKYENKYGITWQFGYSKGGWGSRENKPQFEGEVCKECYGVFDKKSTEFNKSVLSERIGKNKQEVVIKQLKNIG